MIGASVRGVLDESRSAPTRPHAALFLAVLATAGVLAACGDASTETTPEQTGTGVSAASPTATAAPDPTTVPPSDTPTPEPTSTSTPEPTSTPTPEPTSTPTPEPTSTPTPEPSPGATASDTLDAALADTAALDSFRFDIEVSYAIESADLGADLLAVALEISGDFSAPDMVQAVVSMSLGFLTIETEFVGIGDEVYVRDPDTGLWVTEESAGIFPNPSGIIAQEAADFRDITLAGTETLGGIEYLVIEAVADALGTSGDDFGTVSGDFDVTVWVGVADGLIGQIRTEGDIDPTEGGPLGAAGVEGSAVMTLTMRLSGYNQDVTIEAPTQPIAAPTPHPTAESTPLTDHTSLSQFSEAMAAVESAHVEGEMVLKESADAEASLLLQRFTGDGVLDGDSQITGTIEFNFVGFAGEIGFEARRVGGVNYSQDPVTGQWDVSPPDDPGMLTDLFDASFIGASDLVDPTITRETLDGIGVLRIEGSGGGDDLPMGRKVLWVGEDDYLLRQLSLEAVLPASDFPGMLPPGGGDEIHMSLTARYSRYGEPVTVQAP